MTALAAPAPEVNHIQRVVTQAYQDVLWFDVIVTYIKLSIHPVDSGDQLVGKMADQVLIHGAVELNQVEEVHTHARAFHDNHHPLRVVDHFYKTYNSFYVL